MAPVAGVGSRQRIIDSATRLFAARGYHGTGVAEIGADAGVARGAMYHHFRSGKQEMLFEVVSICANDEQLAFATGVVDADATADEKIRRLSRHLMRTIAENRLAWTVFFRDSAALEGDFRDDVQRRRDRYEKAWLDVVAAGQRSGELRPVDPVVVNGILGMHNYAYLWLVADGRLTPDEIADTFCGVLLDGMRA